MKNILEAGMKFDNMIELCDYIGWEYSYQHSARLGQKLSKYVDYHRDGRNKIVVDKILNSDIKPVLFKARKNSYLYNKEDVVDTNSGKVRVLEQTHKFNNSGVKRKAYKVECMACGYTYIDYEYTLSKGVGCGCCNNKIIVKGVNDMWTTDPDLAKMLENKEDGYRYSKKSSKKLNWICPICKTVHKQKSISNISQKGLNCACHRTKSYPNRFMYWLLDDLKIHFEDEKCFSWAGKRRYDFYIPSLNTIIEMNGSQHYVERSSFTRKSLKDEQDNDAIKTNLALENGISHYVVINSSQSDFDFIRKNVINSDLKNLLSFADVDWEKIQEKCENNIIYEIANYWNAGIHKAEEIGNIVGLSKSPVAKYLNKCEKFGLIKKYDKTDIFANRDKKSRDSYYQKNSNPIKCNENGIYFGSITICKERMNELTGFYFSHSNIVGTITGKYTHHHHFTFSYVSRKEFNANKESHPESTFGDKFTDISITKNMT